MQLGSLEGAASPPQCDPGAKPKKILAILHSKQLKTERAHCETSEKRSFVYF